MRSLFSIVLSRRCCENWIARTKSRNLCVCFTIRVCIYLVDWCDGDQIGFMSHTHRHTNARVYALAINSIVPFICMICAMRLPHLFIWLIFFISSKYLSYLKWYRTLIKLCIAPRNRRYFFHITAMENAKSEREGVTSMYCLVFTLYSHKQIKWSIVAHTSYKPFNNKIKQSKKVCSRDSSVVLCTLRSLKSLVALALTVIICKRWSDKKRSRWKRQQRWKRWMERDNY